MKAFILFISLTFSFSALATTKEEVSEKTKAAAIAAADYSVEQKEQFQKDMEVKLQDLKSEIADLKKSASEKSGKVKAGMKEKIAALESKQDEMKKDLAKLKKSSGKAWTEMKSGMNAAWDSLSKSYAKAKSEFSESK
ncbi:sll1863 family stress response protein [Bdellovibrio reynosensis]|uniref:Coiled coil domain-containing protein n=1 Tax=Bdellovibrio reynosensis TaxID=2835041 RepID=A0ABY4CB73_9BACT|nr:hypothetical protein [Bdellovibrio reynosensis]UOF00763.1 hypothetical protein MNR06_13755 [Bdellovibrio reynosensis]